MAAHGASSGRSSDRARIWAIPAAVLFWFGVIGAEAQATPDRCLSATAQPQAMFAPVAAVAPQQANQASAQAGGEAKHDGGVRLVAQVYVSGQGPFPFIIDTGANRTAISRELAQRLGLAPIGAGEVNSVYGIATAPMVAAQRLDYASLPLLTNDDMPLIAGEVLAGQAGLLGVDSMASKRLRMDFERQCIEISAAVNRFDRGGWTMVPGSLRFGSLIVVEGLVQRRRVNVLIDTGSDATLANLAFANQFARTIHFNPQGRTETRAYTMGDPVILTTAAIIPSLQIGDVEVGNITAYIGDFHVFQLFNMITEPTLLIGMDVLSRTRAIVMDFSDGSVYFKLRPTLITGSRIPVTMGEAQVIEH